MTLATRFVALAMACALAPWSACSKMRSKGEDGRTPSLDSPEDIIASLAPAQRAELTAWENSVLKTCAVEGAFPSLASVGKNVFARQVDLARVTALLAGKPFAFDEKGAFVMLGAPRSFSGKTRSRPTQGALDISLEQEGPTCVLKIRGATVRTLTLATAVGIEGGSLAAPESEADTQEGVQAGLSVGGSSGGVAGDSWAGMAAVTLPGGSKAYGVRADALASAVERAFAPQAAHAAFLAGILGVPKDQASAHFVPDTRRNETLLARLSLTIVDGTLPSVPFARGASLIPADEASETTATAAGRKETRLRALRTTGGWTLTLDAAVDVEVGASLGGARTRATRLTLASVEMETPARGAACVDARLAAFATLGLSPRPGAAPAPVGLKDIVAACEPASANLLRAVANVPATHIAFLRRLDANKENDAYYLSWFLQRNVEAGATVGEALARGRMESVYLEGAHSAVFALDKTMLPAHARVRDAIFDFAAAQVVPMEAGALAAFAAVARRVADTFGERPVRALLTTRDAAEREVMRTCASALDEAAGANVIAARALAKAIDQSAWMERVSERWLRQGACTPTVFADHLSALQAARPFYDAQRASVRGKAAETSEMIEVSSFLTSALDARWSREDFADAVLLADGVASLTDTVGVCAPFHTVVARFRCGAGKPMEDVFLRTEANVLAPVHARRYAGAFVRVRAALAVLDDTHVSYRARSIARAYVEGPLWKGCGPAAFEAKIDALGRHVGSLSAANYDWSFALDAILADCT